ncbi:MAG: protein phosphatase 2C domain-containing protein [Acidobacteria bacterium]|nr:protein phosphatase 2C domain-containing protein [Acidobacteriota bacterium]
MQPTTPLLAAGLSDTGRQRQENEDRIHVDPVRGVFIVADGLGGHAAGEKAAETAVEMILTRLSRKVGAPEDRMREAIAVANNEILKLANGRADWQGMASVVTVALVEDGVVTVGHVGDSRLYLLTPGAIRKKTHDHSPVGELEDAGQLTETAAMAHPRRNEVFRDLGSQQHGPDDDEFIEIIRFPFSPNMAMLLCSDGLSDQIPAERIRRSVETHAGNPQQAVRELVRMANEAGGKDNVSIVLVEGAEYRVAPPAPAPELAPRAPLAAPARKSRPALMLVLGALLCLALFAAVRPYIRESGDGLKLEFGTVRGPAVWKVTPDGPLTLAAALAQAREGDSIVAGPGVYRDKVRLATGVALINEPRRTATLEGGEVSADNVRRSRLVGFKISGPATVGLRLMNSEVEVTDVQVTGMLEAGILVEGDAPSLIRASTIAGNPGSGVVVRGAAAPAITNNVIVGNGKTPGALRPGLHIAGTAEPVITGNVIADSGVEQIWASPLFNADSLTASNFLAPGAKERKALVKVVTR